MATIKSAFRLYDGMSPALKSINNALRIVITNLESMQSASSNPIDVSGLRAAKEELDQANVSINSIEENIERARQEEEKFNNETRKSTNLMNNLKSAVVGVAGAMGLKKALDLSDTITQNNARLNLMNDGLRTNEELQRSIFVSAQSSRGVYNDIAKSVGKLGLLASEAFSGNDEIIHFAELLNKQFKIGGASVQEQSAAMYQLTQAMSAGRLQGDEFRSIMENAPMLARAIADEFGVSVGELREMSSEGRITSNIIKNAMFNAADETNAMFEQMPWTWAEVWNVVLNTLQDYFNPFLEFLGGAASWIGENWDTLEPILTGIATALIIGAAAFGIYTVATHAATYAQWALNAAMTANPWFWIVAVIALVIGALFAFGATTIGIKATWLEFVDAMKTSWSTFVIAIASGIFAVQKFINKMTIVWLGVRNAVVGYVIDMGVNVLTSMQDMVNGAIGILNAFINTLNKIEGVSINAIDEVTFATGMDLAAAAYKQSMASDLANKSDIMADWEALKETELINMVLSEDAAHQDRQNEITAAQNGGGGGGAIQSAAIGDIAFNTGGTASNTEDLLNSMDESTEELKYIRDAAEQEAVNRFTTAEIKIDMTNYNDIGTETDIDGIVEQLEEKLQEAMETVAEGEYSYD